jgi:hypothetical protein
MADHVLQETRPTTLSVPSLRAYQILHLGYTALPILAGIDKFTHLLVNWDQYLSPVIAGILPIDGHLFMQIVGVIEIVAGILVFFKPRIGAHVVAFWLWGIIINLMTAGTYYDIALRDFGLSLGALALAKLAAGKAH